MELTSTKYFQMNIEYQGQFASGFDDHSGALQVNWRF
jgi:uncharacterized protein with beta-barrel porin domain